MTKLARIIGLLAALCAIPATAQTQFPTTLPANTVWGRLGISAGPGQAIPVPIFTNNLLQAISGDLTCTINPNTCTINNGAVFGSKTTFTQSGTGAVARTYDSVLKEKWPSLKDFGAVCDGVTNDATALTNAAAAFSVVYLGPPASGTGTQCKIATLAAAMTGRLFGENAQILDGSGNQRGYFFSAVGANQAYTAANESSIDTAFNGNFTGSQFAVEHRITGAATLTQPTTGYVYSPWAYPHYTYLFNSSGFNNDTADNGGRTAAVAYRTVVAHAGQGDAVAYNCSGVVSGARAGATSFLANPAVVCQNGNLTAGAAGTYLNPVEYALADNGFDAAGIGYVTSLNRTVNTGALGVVWGGDRVQSTGSKAIDFAFSATGPTVTGLDLTGATLTANEGIAFVANNRIDWNATQSGQFKVTPSTTYTDYNSANTCVETVVGNKSTTCLDTNGHLRVMGTSPAVTAGGGTSPSVTGSDIAGRISTGSTASTTITITFATAYNSAPFCTATPLAFPTTTAFQYTVTNTTLVATYASATALNIEYLCYAPSGG